MLHAENSFKNFMRIKNSFVIGVLTGIGIGYYLATEDKEELMESVKDTAKKMKDTVSAGVEKGKKLVEDIKGYRQGD